MSPYMVWTFDGFTLGEIGVLITSNKGGFESSQDGIQVPVTGIEPQHRSVPVAVPGDRLSLPCKRPSLRMIGLPQLSTPSYQCFSVKFGVFDQDQLAVATATNFGMRGPGRLYIFSPFSHPSPTRTIDTEDALYDVAWSETSPTVLVGASADGSILLFDLNSSDNKPRHVWKRVHSREVSSVDWNGLQKDTLAASSFDGAVSLFNAKTGQQISQIRITDNSCTANEASWNPREASSLAVASGDGSLRVLDGRSGLVVHRIDGAHQGETLCVDWNKYDSAILATGSVDQQVKVWDLRSPNLALLSTSPPPQVNLSGHYRAVKRVKFSPFHRSHLTSCGYDMTVRFWNANSLVPAVRPAYTQHTEFVLGLAYSLKRPSVLASCSWDDTIHFHDCSNLRSDAQL